MERSRTLRKKCTPLVLFGDRLSHRLSRAEAKLKPLRELLAVDRTTRTARVVPRNRWPERTEPAEMDLTARPPGKHDLFEHDAENVEECILADFRVMLPKHGDDLPTGQRFLYGRHNPTRRVPAAGGGEP